MKTLQFCGPVAAWYLDVGPLVPGEQFPVDDETAERLLAEGNFKPVEPARKGAKAVEPAPKGKDAEPESAADAT